MKGLLLLNDGRKCAAKSMAMHNRTTVLGETGVEEIKGRYMIWNLRVYRIYRAY